MKKLFYLLPFLVLFQSSCTMMVKGLAKTVAKHYDDHKDVNLSDLELINQNGQTEKFGTSFTGKTVYLYAWEQQLPRTDQDADYAGLKKRFAKYNDVVFINIYTGSSEKDWQKIQNVKNERVAVYRLSSAPQNAGFKKLVDSSTVVNIIGKDGALLGFKGPTPSDKLLVDYALDQARTGIDATTSTKTMIKGINSNRRFKNPVLYTWYENHFGIKPADKLSVSISNNGN